MSCLLNGGIESAEQASPAQFENEICAKYSSKFKNMHTQLPIERSRNFWVRVTGYVLRVYVLRVSSSDVEQERMCRSAP
ncbi:MAG: hypothetical protein ACQ9MH_19275, partial [Nitrospinales bacterium]